MNVLTNHQALLLGDLLTEREKSLKASIQEHLGRLRASETANAGAVADPAAAAARAQTDLMRENEQSAVLRELRELHAIESQRARIATHRAGACVDCGDAVGFQRLRALPAASRCFHCQDLYEHTHLRAAEAAAARSDSSRL